MLSQRCATAASAVRLGGADSWLFAGVSQSCTCKDGVSSSRAYAASTGDHPGSSANTTSQAECPQPSMRASADWDWAFVVGRNPGRKPAIKRPQRHQWHFCNPNYDPNKPLPDRILPPHAPPAAALVDDWRLFHAALGGKLHAKSRKEFVRFLKLRDVDWRNAFHRGLAEYLSEFKKEQRTNAEKARQHAWHEYREKVFAQALEQGAKTTGR